MGGFTFNKNYMLTAGMSLASWKGVEEPDDDEEPEDVFLFLGSGATIWV